MKKYQIFVSSTYEDLKNERKNIIENILDMGNIPAGMELFNSSNKEAFDYIKKIIDDSDYFVLVLGECYGSINKNTKISYTEMEYNYAKEKNIPILVFIKESTKTLNKRTKDAKNVLKFIQKAKDNRLVKFWKDEVDLIPKIFNSINKAIESSPMPGWERKNGSIKKDTSIKDYIISNYKNGNSWYEKYKSGKIRQGGIITVTNERIRYINLFYPYSNSTYNVQLQCIDNTDILYKIKQISPTYIKLVIEKNPSTEPCNFSFLTEGY